LRVWIEILPIDLVVAVVDPTIANFECPMMEVRLKLLMKTLVLREILWESTRMKTLVLRGLLVH